MQPIENKEEYFNPEMLILARQARGISQRELAEKLRVSPAWLSKVEGGIKNITPDQLIRASNLLDYPIEFFTSTKRIYGPSISELFHRKRKDVPIKILDKNQAQMEIRRMNLAEMLKSLDISEIDIPTFDINEFDGNIKDIARAVRAHWMLPSGSVRNVTQTIEEARGIIIPFNFGTKKIDATSCWPPNMPPLFFADITVPSDRLRFSLCHELGHLVMHQDAPNPEMEKQADNFAAEFLMPERDIRIYLSDLSIEKLATLKPYWKVSMAALLFRARELGETSPRHYRTLWTIMGTYGFRTREPIELNLPVEKPILYEEIIGVFSNDMGYSLFDLARLLRLHEHEVCHVYFGAKPNLRDEEVEAAIKEAENIIRRYEK